ncbi:glycosyltransferase family 4 protein [Patescibacteria group bacterium]
MKIGIDARFYRRAGPGRYTKSVVQHLEKVDNNNEYVVFLTKDGFEEYQPQNPNFKKILADYPWYSFAEQTTFLWKVMRQKLDLYYVPHFNIPVLYSGKIVTAIPDMTMHKFSTRFSTTLPQWYFAIKKVVYKMVFWWAVHRSKKVIVPSQTVLKDFQEYLNFKKDKYVVALEGVDPDFLKTHPNPQEVLDKYSVSRNYILYVGSMYEHKNVPNLIEMYKILKNKYGYKGQFVLISKKDEFSKRIKLQIEDEKLESDIILPAYKVESDKKTVVSDLEVTAFRQKADAYVIAALTEGFSLTALEGMVHGLPAVISDIECHREIYGDSALYFDPNSPENMAEKVNQMLTGQNLRNEFMKKGYEQVKKYDWTKTAEITLKVFESV